MKTENHSINNVLAKNATSFFIPPFQRAYAWGKPELERYFSDIMRIIDSELDPSQHDKLEHFFGTVVIKEEINGFTNRSIVVDGQQRLTTTLLFLIALRDIESKAEDKEFITQNYLKNNVSDFQDKIKLKQVTKDWDAYRALVNKNKAKPGMISNAYHILIKMLIDKRKQRHDIDLSHYITAIQRMNVAVIFLDERPFKGEDPQIIFETLNSLGKPLTLSDLVRNYVLLNMDSKSQLNVYENTWHPKIEAVLKESSSDFFRDYLQYKIQSSIKAVSDNNTKEIYQEFKSFVKSKFSTHSVFIDDIVRYVRFYNWIITEVVVDQISTDTKNNNEIKQLLRNIFHDIQTEAFKPFVMGVLSYHHDKPNGIRISDNMLISILTDIRTYLIRRRILGLTQGENKSIVLLTSRIEDLLKGKISMLELLSNMFYKLRLPNDEEMNTVLKSINFYEQLKKYAKFILGIIEENRTKVAVDFRNPKITIEHIMPQKLTQSWIVELGENYNVIHEQYLHNIGNLILTEFNSEIGNKPFSEKKSKLKNSSLKYRMNIINKTSWNENSIKNHQKNMITWFLETFSLPEEYQKKSNWNIKEIDITRFSPLDNEASDFAENNKPVELIIENDIIKVSTWQDVFIMYLNYIQSNNNYDFQFIYENQTDLFNKEDTIIKWSYLKLLIDNNLDLKNRYKTFDGKICDKVKDITDDMLFIHINMSASTCMTRVANIMNKFNVPENSVNIVLK